MATTFYGISFNITGFGLNIYLTQLTYAVIELPTKIIVYYLLDMIGRRPSMVGAMGMCAVCLGVNILIPKGEDDCEAPEADTRVALISPPGCFQTCLW